MESQVASLNDQVKEENKDYLDFLPIKQRLSALSQRCSLLRRNADDQEKKLDKIVNEMTIFVTATGELRGYIEVATDKLDNLDPIHNDGEVIEKQLAEVKVRMIIVFEIFSM